MSLETEPEYNAIGKSVAEHPGTVYMLWGADGKSPPYEIVNF